MLFNIYNNILGFPKKYSMFLSRDSFESDDRDVSNVELRVIPIFCHTSGYIGGEYSLDYEVLAILPARLLLVLLFPSTCRTVGG